MLEVAVLDDGKGGTSSSAFSGTKRNNAFPGLLMANLKAPRPGELFSPEGAGAQITVGSPASLHQNHKNFTVP